MGRSRVEDFLETKAVMGYAAGKMLANILQPPEQVVAVACRLR